MYTGGCAKDQTSTGLVLILQHLEQEGLLGLFFAFFQPGVRNMSCAKLTKLQEAGMWVTSMDSPLCPRHVVVTSCFFSSMFGIWKTGDMLNPVV